MRHFFDDSGVAMSTRPCSSLSSFPATKMEIVSVEAVVEAAEAVVETAEAVDEAVDGDDDLLKICLQYFCLKCK